MQVGCLNCKKIDCRMVIDLLQFVKKFKLDILNKSLVLTVRNYLQIIMLPII